MKHLPLLLALVATLLATGCPSQTAATTCASNLDCPVDHTCNLFNQYCVPVLDAGHRDADADDLRVDASGRELPGADAVGRERQSSDAGGRDRLGSDATGRDNAVGPPPLDIYRSVGPGHTNPLAEGGTIGNIRVVNGEATFASALPAQIGVGDIIGYDTDSDGSIDSLAMIVGRGNGLTFYVRATDGTAATGTSVATVS